MLLELNGIDVDCIIGERSDERNRLQRLRVDVKLWVNDRAAKTDEIADAVDYALVTQRVRAALVGAKCRLIERAALVAAEEVAGLANVVRVSARVTKTGSVAHLESAAATYESEVVK